MNAIKLPCPSPAFTDAVRTIGEESLTKGRRDPVTALERAVISELLRGRPRGNCTAPSIFGLYWNLIKDGKAFGVRFRAAVRAGQIPDLVFGFDDGGSGTKKYLHRPRAIATSASDTEAANASLVLQSA